MQGPSGVSAIMNPSSSSITNPLPPSLAVALALASVAGAATESSAQVNAPVPRQVQPGPLLVLGAATELSAHPDLPSSNQAALAPTLTIRGVAIASMRPDVVVPEHIQAATTAGTITCGLVYGRQAVLGALREAADLELGWDFRGGTAPTKEATLEAVAFVQALPFEVPNPYVEPSPDGEVNLVWREGPRYLEVGFYGDGTFSYYGRELEGSPPTVSRDAPVTPNHLPVELREFLRGFYGDDVHVREA